MTEMQGGGLESQFAAEQARDVRATDDSLLQEGWKAVCCRVNRGASRCQIC